MPFAKSDVYVCPNCKFPLYTKELLVGDSDETRKTKYCEHCGKSIASDLTKSLANLED